MGSGCEDAGLVLGGVGGSREVVGATGVVSVGVGAAGVVMDAIGVVSVGVVVAELFPSPRVVMQAQGSSDSTCKRKASCSRPR